MIFGRAARVVADVGRMAAGVGVVVLVIAVVLRSDAIDLQRWVHALTRWQWWLLGASLLVYLPGRVMERAGWRYPDARRATHRAARTAARKAAWSDASRATPRAARKAAWREFERVRGRGDEDAVAAVSAPLAATAWDPWAPPRQVILIAGYLAGNEAETHLFGLDRLAFCCTVDGSVPVEPAERLAAAEALALRGAAVGASDLFAAAALALVRLAQGRHAAAAELLRPHLGDDPQVDALFAVTLLDDDPVAAVRAARAAWESLTEEQRRQPMADTVAHALAHVERAASGEDVVPRVVADADERAPAGSAATPRPRVRGGVRRAALALVAAAVLRARDDVTAERARAWRRLRRSGGDEQVLATLSAPLAALAWDDGTPARRAVSTAVRLAGHEAETQLFGLDRLAGCCREDGAVPIDPAERLVAAEALALRGFVRGPSAPLPATALALVRLAQGRHGAAADVLRPHLDHDLQVRALYAVARLDVDPDAARHEARAAWQSLSAKQRRRPPAGTIRRALAHVEKRAAPVGSA